MHLQETIFSSGSGSITLHDIQTGVSISSFKGSNTSTHCTAHLESTASQGGLILAAQNDKGLLNVWNFQKDQIALKIVLPEKLTCLALDPRAEYCAGGTAQGRIYLWETSSGILFNTWDAHYRAVRVLTFTADGHALVSGSDDSGVSVWSLASLLDNDSQSTLPAPASTLSDHTLPITDIVCGFGPYPKCRLLTASVDCSVKLWDLSKPSSTSLLTTFLFPTPVSCLAFDLTERYFFAGSPTGVVHRMDLFTKKALGIGLDAVGGLGSLDVIRVGEDESVKNRIVIGDAVTTLAISATGSMLLVGTSTGSIHVYDIPSSQRLRTVAPHKGSPITMLSSMFKPCDLIGHVSLGNEPKDSIPVKPILPFHRVKDAKIREAHELSVLLDARNLQDIYQTDETYYSSSSLLEDHAYFVQPQSQTQHNAIVVDTAKIQNLEAQIELLKKELGKAKGINDAMWEGVVKNVVYGGTKGEDEMDVVA